ncbi:MAG TPA: M36 family metallopeptidase [Kofleriaceae bacterium]|nr:M36 family metallopeptidase [Kofleriaceae bacterium]
MFVRFRTLAVPSLLFAAACSSGSSSPPPGDPGNPGDPGAPGNGQPGKVDPNEVTLGVSVMSRDASGAPRLIRAIVPRPAAAGATPEIAARDHVAALAPLWVKSERPMTLVENGSQQLRNGASLVRLSQQVDGAVVDQGELRVMLHADGSFAAVSGTLLPTTVKPHFVSSAREALEHALDKQFGAARARVAITERADSGGWQALDVASTADLKVESARARRELVRVGDTLTEAWALEVFGDAAPDPLSDPSIPSFSAHRYLVADAGGRILKDTNLTQSDAFVYRVYAETTGVRRPLDGPLESFAPHPTGFPDGSTPSIIPSNLVVMDSFNGPLDPWLPNNATTTSGNNAEAFADLNADRVFGPGDFRPEVKSGRVLNYTYDHTLEPLATPDQSKAAAVNAFFLVNWMHDWFYDSGFTEANGNAQLDNYGRGGVAGDPLLITSQAGALTGLRNNADMSTPLDGARPRMRMFLWTAGTQTNLTTPLGTPHSEAFAAGPRNFDLTGDLVAVTDATAPTDDGCQPITNAAAVAGKIALVTFSGVCGSAATVNNVKAAGAIGVVLADGALDDPRGFAGSAAANIPGLAIGKTDGAALVAALAAGPVSVTLHSQVSGPERDGDFDNSVVAHEWGHYLHHRLADCGAQQCGGMSEGWGDFNALLMMVRDGDNRDGVYAAAPYAVGDGSPNTAYFGIRRFPYSRDRTKNDLSFRHISDGVPLPTTTPGFPGGTNSEVHNTGEVWATMMWEALNVLADQHGVAVARRRMSDYVVAGLLLTPPDATFTEGRDGILAAASALDTDDMILMAAAFAGRGAGSCAVAPSNSTPGNAGVVESGTLAGKFAVGGVSLTDDGISCDHDGYLDPGESGTLHLTVANNGILAAENVTIAATTTNTGVRLGAPIKMNALQPFSSTDLAIPVTVLPTAPRNTVVTINLKVTGTNTCDKTGVTVNLSLRTGADDVPSTAKVDHVDTRISAWTASGGAVAADVWGRTTDATGNQSYLGKDEGFPTDTQFTSPPIAVSATDPFVVKISHAFQFEGAGAQLFDGGMIELSTDGGATFSDVSTLGVTPGYTGALFVGSDNPLAGRQAFSGTSPGFPGLRLLTLDFGTRFAGQTVLLRFRIGTDAGVGGAGWIIDDIDLSGVTNLPFPTLVSEPSTCTARRADTREPSVVQTRSAPATSLRDYDAAVCILADAP